MAETKISSRRAFLQTGSLAGAGFCLGSAKIQAEAPAPVTAPNLQVSDLKCHVLKTGQILIEVLTNGGIAGFGECSSKVGGEEVAPLLEGNIKQRLMGQSPFSTEKIWEHAFPNGPKRKPTAGYLNALAGVDLALWDIMGKALGVPCYALLGGKVRDNVRLCASAECGAGAEEIAGRLMNWVKRGFKAVKIRLSRSDTKIELDIAHKVRSALGETVSMAVDANHAYSVHQAIMIGRKLEKIKCALFEAPLIRHELEDYTRLCIALDIPIGAGEQEQTLREFKDLLVKKSVDVLQPDLFQCGGLTGLRKIGALAATFDRPIQCRNYLPTIATAAYYHFWISSPMCSGPQEYPVDDYPLRDSHQFLTEPLAIQNGCLALPDRPGLGIDIQRAEVAKLRVKSGIVSSL